MTTNTKMRMTAIVATTAVVLAGTGATGAYAAGRTDAHRDAMRDVARQVLAIGAPGYMARIDDGLGVELTVAGVADTAARRRLTGREQFEVGSNTKTFMSALALQLVDQRKLTLDAPVAKYLPGVVPNGAHITDSVLHAAMPTMPASAMRLVKNPEAPKWFAFLHTTAPMPNDRARSTARSAARAPVAAPGPAPASATTNAPKSATTASSDRLPMPPARMRST